MWSRATWSWEPPRDRAWLFTPGRLAPPSSSLQLSYHAPVLDNPATLGPKPRFERVVEGA
jgi:hypothetical protein